MTMAQIAKSSDAKMSAGSSNFSFAAGTCA